MIFRRTWSRGMLGSHRCARGSPSRRPISPVQEQLQSHQSEVREEPWEFSLAIELSDKNDTSMAMVFDAYRAHQSI